MHIQLDSYIRQSYINYSRYVVVIAIVGFFISIGCSLGWIVGNLAFFVNLLLKHAYVDYILEIRYFSKLQFFLYYLVSLGLLLIPGYLFYFIFGLKAMIAVFLGTFGYKFFIMIKQFFRTEE